MTKKHVYNVEKEKKKRAFGLDGDFSCSSWRLYGCVFCFYNLRIKFKVAATLFDTCYQSHMDVADSCQLGLTSINYCTS